VDKSTETQGVKDVEIYKS